MAVLRWLAIALVAACTAASLDVAAQTPAPAQQPGVQRRRLGEEGPQRRFPAVGRIGQPPPGEREVDRLGLQQVQPGFHQRSIGTIPLRVGRCAIAIALDQAELGALRNTLLIGLAEEAVGEVRSLAHHRPLLGQPTRGDRGVGRRDGAVRGGWIRRLVRGA